MDAAWTLRAAYAQASQARRAQDAFCSAAQAGLWQGLGDYPEASQWDLLIDVLRGKVKVYYVDRFTTRAISNHNQGGQRLL